MFIKIFEFIWDILVALSIGFMVTIGATIVGLLIIYLMFYFYGA